MNNSSIYIYYLTLSSQPIKISDEKVTKDAKGISTMNISNDGKSLVAGH